MRYSVIIPVYNRPDEVDELLQSLTEQSFKDFEVVKYEYKTKKDANGKDYNYLEVIVKSTK